MAKYNKILLCNHCCYIYLFICIATIFDKIDYGFYKINIYIRKRERKKRIINYYFKVILNIRNKKKINYLFSY